MRFKTVLLLIVFVFTFSRDARALTDAELVRVRDGFEARRDAALATLAGRPFRAAKKNPPLSPGRAPYVRAYAWSVTDFAMKTFLLGEPPAPANAALIELFHYFSDNPAVRNDYDNFYWSMDVVCRLVEFYGRAGTRAAGRLSPEAEDAALAMMFLWVKENSRLTDAEFARSKTWTVWGSENHHLMRFSTAWHFSRLLLACPEYRDRPYDDGAPPRAHHDAWTAYAKQYLAERARKSLFVEIANDGYNTESLKGICNFHEFAADAELRRRAGLLLDLYWACWAQEQLGGVRGGGKTRIYPGSGSTHGLARGIAGLAWYYFALGRPSTPAGEDFTFLTSPWRPPFVVFDLALDPAGRGQYEIRQWPLGLAQKDFDNFPQYRLRTDCGGILRYSWCSPDFILGTLIFEARPAADWAAISSQNRWQGAIFAGDPDARIFPQVRALKRNRAYNQHWSAQRRGTLITQKLKTSKGAGEMRVWISGKGIKTVAEAGGWVFAEAPGAFAAVRPARGAYAWQDGEGGGQGGGRWLVPEDPYTPVILEVARKSDFKTCAEFQRKVLANPLKFEKQILEYTSLAGDRFTFFADAGRPPRINGEAPDLTPRASFDGPFIQSPRDSGVVTVQKGERKLVLDFNYGVAEGSPGMAEDRLESVPDEMASAASVAVVANAPSGVGPSSPGVSRLAARRPSTAWDRARLIVSMSSFITGMKSQAISAMSPVAPVPNAGSMAAKKSWNSPVWLVTSSSCGLPPNPPNSSTIALSAAASAPCPRWRGLGGGDFSAPAGAGRSAGSSRSAGTISKAAFFSLARAPAG